MCVCVCVCVRACVRACVRDTQCRSVTKKQLKYQLVDCNDEQHLTKRRIAKKKLHCDTTHALRLDSILQSCQSTNINNYTSN